MFSPEDRARAEQAWHVYMFEINGAGLRWEFDGRPGRMDYVLGRAARHFRELDRFAGQVRRFGEFVQDLETFNGRSVTHPHPMALDTEHFPPTTTRNIDDETVNTYRQMHKALVRYVDALREHGSESDEVATAAHAVAYIVNPDGWRNAGAPVPEGIKWYVGLGTRWYLEAVMAGNQQA